MRYVYRMLGNGTFCSPFLLTSDSAVVSHVQILSHVVQENVHVGRAYPLPCEAATKGTGATLRHRPGITYLLRKPFHTMSRICALPSLMGTPSGTASTSLPLGHSKLRTSCAAILRIGPWAICMGSDFVPWLTSLYDFGGFVSWRMEQRFGVTGRL